jgi:predicted O-methyltransferase YrrM
MSNSWMIKNYVIHIFKAKRGGHGVHSPFVYQLVENVFNNRHHFYAFGHLGALRKKLRQNESELNINDMGAGSQKLHSAKRKVKDIAIHGISSQRQAELLFRLCTYLKCKTIIELGTSLGLTTLYLSNADNDSKIYTLEGSDELLKFSKDLFREHERSNITSIGGNFDETLPKLLWEINSFDLFYIDGNHTYDASLRYFKLALKKITSNSVIIFDDIYWSKEMTKAWNEIKDHSLVKLSIDCFYFGMIFFRYEQKEKEHFKLYI